MDPFQIKFHNFPPKNILDPGPGPGPGPGLGPGFGPGSGPGHFFIRFIGLVLKLVHMVRYELILRLDGALWLTIIFRRLRTPKSAMKIKLDPQNQ